jgi:hypothetical protein
MKRPTRWLVNACSCGRSLCLSDIRSDKDRRFFLRYYRNPELQGGGSECPRRSLIESPEHVGAGASKSSQSIFAEYPALYTLRSDYTEASTTRFGASVDQTEARNAYFFQRSRPITADGGKRRRGCSERIDQRRSPSPVEAGVYRHCGRRGRVGGGSRRGQRAFCAGRDRGFLTGPKRGETAEGYGPDLPGVDLSVVSPAAIWR